MDFASLLNQANKNAKTATKKLHEVNHEVSKEKAKELEKIKRDKIERQRKEELARQRKEEERKHQYQIPKKTPESSVDKNRVQAFLAKKDEEKRKLDKQKAEEKERLIKLRLSANGGKANKKIAKHFGVDVIDLQVKYGQDRDHVETLVKYKEREEEEAQRLADHYRDGVAKAFAHKKQVEEKVRDGARIKQSGIPKKSLTVVATDGFQSGKQVRTTQQESSSSFRKRPAPEALDFDTLMKKAANGGKEDQNERSKKNGESYSSTRSRYEHQSSRDRPSSSSTSSSRDRPSSSSTSSSRPPHSSYARSIQSSSFKIPKPNQGFVPAPFVPNGLLKKREDEPLPSGIIIPQQSKRSMAKGDNRVTREELSSISSSSTSSSAPISTTLNYPTDARGKRILPGDIRYKQWLDEKKKEIEERAKNHPPPPPPPQSKSSNMKTSSKSSSSLPSNRQSSSSSSRIPSSSNNHSSSSSSKNNQSSLKRSLPSNGALSSSSSSSKSRPPSSYPSSSMTKSSRPSMSKTSKYEEERRKIMMREQRMREMKKRMQKEQERERNRSSFMKGQYSDEEEEEEDDDEYGSDLDDFIDDTDDVDEFSRNDFEETLKSINKNYDTRKWKMNERMIDERFMHSSFRQVEKEERASARAGIREDINEAIKGKSEAL